ncbi:hypothetical protein [Sinorhizobium saheli]|uniref:Phasin domain-containing protein n=1 Tax=Sinorhizobium saheli TaxID=36856 RepID=A0A178Y5U4_SINSA|nr:hypothetical protein [Sinorhizobium saheli]MQW89767.1 hypothetical protein [Sinorhizobium saheli]OAP42105.1 hypothetical protein ATB98_06785 [Sinorhizobium saheli]
MSKEIAGSPLAPCLPRWPMGVYARTMFLSMARIQAATLQSMLRCQIETLTFVEGRSKQHLKFWEELLAADYARDGFDLYCSFWRNTLRDYSDEADRMAEIGNELAAEMVKRTRVEQEVLTNEVATQMVM